MSTLRGEGELSNLELDEAVLTEILDLPSWLRLSKAVCNKVAIKVSASICFSIMVNPASPFIIRIYTENTQAVSAQ